MILMTPGEQPLAKDRGTLLAEERTSLAVDRTAMAAERTLMAWMRTTLSMISFGFTLAKLFQFLEESQKGPVVGIFGRTWSPGVVGVSMMAIGIVALIFAIFQHWNTLKSLRAAGLESKLSLSLIVSSLIAGLGLFALISLLAGK